jgi:hypothetical protein
MDIFKPKGPVDLGPGMDVLNPKGPIGLTDKPLGCNCASTRERLYYSIKKREEELLWTNTRGLRMKGDNSPLWQMVELALLMEKMRQSENPPSEKDDTI